MKLPETCLCGKPMHISKMQMGLLKMMSKRWGEYKTIVLTTGKKYKVPVYYILVHGIKGKDFYTENCIFEGLD